MPLSQVATPQIKSIQHVSQGFGGLAAININIAAVNMAKTVLIVTGCTVPGSAQATLTTGTQITCNASTTSGGTIAIDVVEYY